MSHTPAGALRGLGISFRSEHDTTGGRPDARHEATRPRRPVPAHDQGPPPTRTILFDGALSVVGGALHRRYAVTRGAFPLPPSFGRREMFMSKDQRKIQPIDAERRFQRIRSFARARRGSCPQPQAHFQT